MTVNKPTLVNVISDNALLEKINQKIAEKYELSSFSTLDDCLARGLSSANLLLCQKEFLESDSNQSLERLLARYDHARILIIGKGCEISTQISLLKQGARGYFDYSTSIDKLLEALQCVLHGEVWIDRDVVTGLVNELVEVPVISTEQKQAVESLSPKELEVAKLVSHGATNKMIAKAMDIAERTVKAHLTAIFKKMELSDRLSLAIFFRDFREYDDQ